MTNVDPTIRGLRESDLDTLYRIRQVAYLDNFSVTNPAVQQLHRERLAYQFGRFVDGRLVSAASWYPFSMYHRGARATVGGLAGVLTAPEARRQGHVRALLGHGLGRLRDQAVGWCLEYPFDTRYYHRFGWDTVANGVFAEVPIERFARFAGGGSPRRISLDDDAAIARIRTIYAEWASSYNFTMVRDEKVRHDWTRVLDGAPWDDATRFVYLMEHGYAVLKIAADAAGEKLSLLDYAFDSAQGRAHVLGLMNLFAGQVHTVCLQLATDDPLAMEWSNFLVAHPHPLHARIVDAATALSGWTAPDEFAVTVEVRDDFCAWNDGVFRVDVVDGQTCAQPSDAAAMVSVDVRGLVRILSGSVTPAAARRVGLVTGEASAAADLCGLPKRACFVPLEDYF